MKKWLILLTSLLAIFFLSVYLYIPNSITIKTEQGINVTQKGLHRMLLDNNSVEKWWPGSKNTSNGFNFNKNKYAISDNNISLLPIIISNDSAEITSSLYIVTVKTDSVQLLWLAAMATSYNPIKRIKAWLAAKDLISDMTVIMQKMKTFYSDDENIYGIKVKKEFVMDSILITTGANITGYPDTRFIYTLIGKLNDHAAANHANSTGYPMLNIEPIDSNNYFVRVALPIDKALPSSAGIDQKRMPGMGNILVVEVKGGSQITLEAYNQIKKYADDYHRSAPAIPFYSLITDRINEPDSSKWITKVYYPVM